MKKVIILSIISLCCKGQDRSKINYFTPIELSYSQKNDSLLEISPFNILTYTSVNPLIAKQIYEKSQEEFYKLNTNIKYLPNDCQKFIDSYISQKVDSTKSGIFYNTMSNKKNIF